MNDDANKNDSFFVDTSIIIDESKNNNNNNKQQLLLSNDCSIDENKNEFQKLITVAQNQFNSALRFF